MSFDPKDNPLKDVKVEIPGQPLTRAFTKLFADLGFKIQDPQIAEATRQSKLINRNF